MKRTAIAIAPVVVLVGALGTVRADSPDARACIKALDAGRQGCIGTAHDTNLKCRKKANRRSQESRLPTLLRSVDSVSAQGSEHYINDVAECREIIIWTLD
jgi:hypothetical protein